MGFKFKCPHCGETIIADRERRGEVFHCYHCGKSTKVPTYPVYIDEEFADEEFAGFAMPGEGAIAMLKLFAWISLIAGIVGAIVIWDNFAKVGSGYSAKDNPIGIGVAIVVLVEGMFSCALFLVIASIAESLIAIRRRLESDK